MRLDGGEARFEITPSTDRLFQVSVGRITVEVLGTVFRIVRDRDAAHVSVERGRARVTWAEHEAIFPCQSGCRFSTPSA